jgi:hypothetical protein
MSKPFKLSLAKLNDGFIQFLAASLLIVLFIPAVWISGVRRSTPYKKFLSWLRLWIAPAFFAFAFVVVAFLFVNHYIFHLRDGFVVFCNENASDGGSMAGQAAELAICDAKKINEVSDGCARDLSAETKQPPTCKDIRMRSSSW